MDKLFTSKIPVLINFAVVPLYVNTKNLEIIIETIS